MAGSAPPTRSDLFAPRRAGDRLGTPAVAFFVMSGIAPLTVVAGVVTTAYAVTGLASIPVAFVAAAVALGLFSAGYVAMARHVTNAAALHEFVGCGLGRVPGVAAALVAVVAYTFLQVGLYGALGAAAARYAAMLHLHAPWWQWALAGWVVIAALGVFRVDIRGRVLAALVTVEILVVLALIISGLLHPARGQLSTAVLAPEQITTPGVGAALVIAVLGFIGYDGGTVLAEETRHRRRGVPAATYLALGVTALLYAGASWAMAAYHGENRVAGVALAQGPGALFALGDRPLAAAARLLYLISLFAAALALHGAVTRYLVVLGRDGVLPAGLARTWRSGFPVIASPVQSCIGVAVIGLYAWVGWDPMVHLFYRLGATGGFGILLLLAITSVAIVAFFARTPTDEPWWRRVLAPTLAAVVLWVVVWLAVSSYATLLGVPPGSPARWLPAIYLAVALVPALRASPRRRRGAHRAERARRRDARPVPPQDDG